MFTHNIKQKDISYLKNYLAKMSGAYELDNSSIKYLLNNV